LNRRLTGLLTAMALMAACDLTPTGELSPREATAPTPPDGLVVGVAVVARTPSTDWATANTVDSYLSFSHQSAAAGELTLARNLWPSRLPPLETYEGAENGLGMSYRPFAIKLRAGRGDIRSFEYRLYGIKGRQEWRMVTRRYKDASGNWKTTSDLKLETFDETYPIVSTFYVPDATFDVMPGKVVYIGRIGMFVHIEQRPGTGPRSCAQSIQKLFLWHDRPCVVREPFIASEPATDLAMIRQRFPGLTGIDIEVRPLAVAPGSWQSLTEVAQPYGAGF
jgi:hypothetical protein